MATVSFEVHAFKDGSWSIEGVHDDKQTAIAEAEEISKIPRYRKVRVIEETYNENTNEAKSRVVFSRSRDDQSPEPKKTVVPKTEEKAEPAENASFERFRSRPAKDQPSPAGRSMLLYALGVAFAGLALIGLLWLMLDLAERM